MACLLSCFRRRRKKSQESIEEYDKERKNFRSRLFAVFLKKKNGKKDNSTSHEAIEDNENEKNNEEEDRSTLDQTIEDGGNEEMTAETENSTTDRCIEVNGNDEKQRAKTAKDLDEAITKDEEKMGLVDEKMPNNRSSMSGRDTGYDDLGDQDNVPPSRPIEVDTVLPVGNSKIIVNPFDNPGNEFRLDEKKGNAMNTRPVKNFWYAENSTSDESIEVSGEKEKYGEVKKSTSNQSIKDGYNGEKNAETENSTTDQDVEVNGNEEKQRAKTANELEKEAITKAEETLGQVGEKMSEYRSIMSERDARYDDLDDSYYVPPSRPVGADTVSPVRTSKIIVNPFVWPGNEFRLAEKEMDAMASDRHVKNIWYAENSTSGESKKVIGEEAKNGEVKESTSNQVIENGEIWEKNAESENSTTDQSIEVNGNKEKLRPKTAQELEEEAIKKTEEKLGLVDEKMPNYRALMSGRDARYDDLDDPYYVPPSRPVEADTVSPVRTSKIIVNPFVWPGNEFRLVEKEMDAMASDRHVKNVWYAENSTSDESVEVNGEEEKNGERKQSTSNQVIENCENGEKNEETENSTTDQSIEVNGNEEKQRAKMAKGVEEEAIKKTERLELVHKKIPNYRAIMSGRDARYDDLGDPDYVSPSRPVEVDTVFPVPTSKINVDPFVWLGIKIRLPEKKVDAMDTDRPVKNFLYAENSTSNESIEVNGEEEKNREVEKLTSNKAIEDGGNEEKYAETENFTTDKDTEDNCIEEKQRAKTAEELEKAITKAEEKLGLVNKKMPNNRSISSGRDARNDDLGDPDYVPPSRLVEVETEFPVRTSKIVVNPFVWPGNEFRQDEKKKVNAVDTDRPLKNILYEHFTPVKEARRCGKGGQRK